LKLKKEPFTSLKLGKAFRFKASFVETDFLLHLYLYPLSLSKKNSMDVKDANGNMLNDGDTVKLTKDLKLKGTSTTIKRGTTVKNIRLTDHADEIDCRINKMNIVLRTEFVKK
jgi:protein PhnA